MYFLLFQELSKLRNWGIKWSAERSINWLLVFLGCSLLSYDTRDKGTWSWSLKLIPLSEHEKYSWTYTGMNHEEFFHDMKRMVQKPFRLMLAKFLPFTPFFPSSDIRRKCCQVIVIQAFNSLSSRSNQKSYIISPWYFKKNLLKLTA